MSGLEHYICMAREIIPDETYAWVQASFIVRQRDVTAAKGGYLKNIVINFFQLTAPPIGEILN